MVLGTHALFEALQPNDVCKLVLTNAGYLRAFCAHVGAFVHLCVVCVRSSMEDNASALVTAAATARNRRLLATSRGPIAALTVEMVLPEPRAML